MKKTFLVAMMVAMVLAAQCALLANPTVPMKWTQSPSMVNAYDVSSEVKVPSIAADDWLCSDPRPVIDVHWWGSYWYKDQNYLYYSDMRQSVPLGQTGAIRSFTFKFWSDVPASGPGTYSHPGTLLDEQTVFAGQFTETPAGQTTYTNFPTLVEDIYLYSAVLPKPFVQTPGTIYWLSIEADFPTPDQQWGWHQADTKNLDYSVQKFQEADWYVPCGGGDLAFELSVPEPGSLAALSVGIIGLAGYAGRRKRRLRSL